MSDPTPPSRKSAPPPPDNVSSPSIPRNGLSEVSPRIVSPPAVPVTFSTFATRSLVAPSRRTEDRPAPFSTTLIKFTPACVE